MRLRSSTQACLGEDSYRVSPLLDRYGSIDRGAECVLPLEVVLGVRLLFCSIVCRTSLSADEGLQGSSLQGRLCLLIKV